ncbi:hypothetical protein, partial [Enterobacter hormaechei]|uniref:hypothetical protein n=1 Tax=Enterobacter hormaechei TaxID=158836 RepID=UPI001BD4C53E
AGFRARDHKVQHDSQENRRVPACLPNPYKQSIIKFHNYNNFVTFKQYLKVATVPPQRVSPVISTHQALFN